MLCCLKWIKSSINGCGNTVTLCGKCRNVSDLGNFMFGFIMDIAGWQGDMVMYSFGFNLGDTSFFTDALGITAGYMFLDTFSNAGALNLNNEEDFCAVINYIDQIAPWEDIINPQCNQPSQTKIPESQFRMRLPSWNRYVSSEFGGPGVSGSTPVAELQGFEGRLVDSVASPPCVRMSETTSPKSLV